MLRILVSFEWQLFLKPMAVFSTLMETQVPGFIFCYFMVCSLTSFTRTSPASASVGIFSPYLLYFWFMKRPAFLSSLSASQRKEACDDMYYCWYYCCHWPINYKGKRCDRVFSMPWKILHLFRLVAIQFFDSVPNLIFFMKIECHSKTKHCA